MASTEQTIRGFYVNAQSKEFARDNLFRVSSLKLGNLVLNEQDLIYCLGLKLPARKIKNVQAKYQGLPFNLPGVAEYPGAEAYVLEFYCDQNSNLRKRFEDETRYVFDDKYSTGDYLTPRASAVIDLIQLDTKLNAVAKYKLIGASIREVGELEGKMSDGTGEVCKFKVTISYHFFEREDVGTPLSLNIGGVSLGF